METRESVVFPMAETTTTTLYLSMERTTSRAISLMRPVVITDVPPNFCTRIGFFIP
jgi:hypothetical protein